MCQKILLAMSKVGCLDSFEKNKRNKIKREVLYQDYDKGGLRMTNIETMIKALRLAWIPRLIQNGHSSWKSVPNYLFKKYN